MARAHVKVHTGGIAAAAEFYQARGDAQPDHRRDPAAARTPRRRARPARRGLRRRHQGRRHRPRQRRRALSRPDPARRQRISRRAGRPHAHHPHHRRPLRRPLDRSRSAAPSPSSAARAASAPRWSPTTSPGRSPATLESDVVVADLDLAFGTAGLDFNQDPTQGIAEAVNAPDRLDDDFLDRLLARCSDHLSLLAAPATLDRTYDFDESAFEQVIDVAQNGVPAVILDLPHVWTAWVQDDAARRRRDRAHRRARSRQSAQRQEPRRPAPADAQERLAAAPRHQQDRARQAARDQDRRLRRRRSTCRRSRSFPSMRSSSAPPPTTAR